MFGAAAGGAEHVSGLNYTLLPEPRPGKPRDDMCVAAVTQSTCLGGAEAPGGGGGGLHHHHILSLPMSVPKVDDAAALRQGLTDDSCLVIIHTLHPCFLT